MRLRWMFTDQPFLPIDTQSKILNASLNLDNGIPVPIGQLPPDLCNFVQDERFVLPALKFSGHMCHPEWFATGEPQD